MVKLGPAGPKLCAAVKEILVNQAAKASVVPQMRPADVRALAHLHTLMATGLRDLDMVKKIVQASLQSSSLDPAKPHNAASSVALLQGVIASGLLQHWDGAAADVERFWGDLVRRLSSNLDPSALTGADKQPAVIAMRGVCFVLESMGTSLHKSYLNGVSTRDGSNMMIGMIDALARGRDFSPSP
mmetsp:Transcript_20775/g.52770  ORF Transcript_20775/g.52770 Transcript_20775/m.52770 type:complete len:185 (-) Transcript_20775:2989-3543(-)